MPAARQSPTRAEQPYYGGQRKAARIREGKKRQHEQCPPRNEAARGRDKAAANSSTAMAEDVASPRAKEVCGSPR